MNDDNGLHPRVNELLETLRRLANGPKRHPFVVKSPRNYQFAAALLRLRQKSLASLPPKTLHQGSYPAARAPAEKEGVSTISAEIRPQKMPDTYFDQVRQFPLTRIRDDAHLAEALAVIEHLLAQKLDKGAGMYLDALADLVEAYEKEQVPIPDASEADVLRELMRSNGLSQARLARETKIAQSTISAVLNGVRKLTRDQAVKLAKFFGIATDAFLSG
jgi:HTH-type transcriptional regulator/antitoxin HigA